MKKKNGFIATSLIYSFFIVFCLLMASILLASTQNRILISSIKSDIRDSLEGSGGFIVTSLEDRTYTVGEEVSFEDEDWIVVKDNSTSVLLILNRALTETEVKLAIGEEYSGQDYLGTCTTGSACQVRACRSAMAGQLSCYYYSSTIYRKPTWDPTEAELASGSTYNFGITIPSAVIKYWFSNHMGLQNALTNGKLKAMSFSDGRYTYPQSGQDSIYVRLLTESEISDGATFASNLPKPFHLATYTNTNVYVYTTSNTKSSLVSTTSAYILPVIEVYKG